MCADALLLVDWTWASPAYLHRRTAPPVAVFAGRRHADVARRTYGRDAWRAMQIVRVIR
jgi:hypothetical protein